ncbi:MAG: hypothetical protein V9E94_03115 [Microthrixaceae bacterium]
MLAAGLATASTFGLVAVIAGRAPAVEVVATSGGAAAPGCRARHGGAGQHATPRGGRSPHLRARRR